MSTQRNVVGHRAAWALFARGVPTTFSSTSSRFNIARAHAERACRLLFREPGKEQHDLRHAVEHMRATRKAIQQPRPTPIRARCCSDAGRARVTHARVCIARATRRPRSPRYASSASRDSTAASRRPDDLRNRSRLTRHRRSSTGDGYLTRRFDGAAKQGFSVVRTPLARDPPRTSACTRRSSGSSHSAAFGHQQHGTLACFGRLGEPADPTLGVGQIGQMTGLGQPELDRIECGDRLGDHRDTLLRISRLAERPSRRTPPRAREIHRVDAVRRAPAGLFATAIICSVASHSPNTQPPTYDHRDRRRMRMPERVGRLQRVEAGLKRGIHVAEAQLREAEQGLGMDLGVLPVQVGRRGVPLGDVQRQRSFELPSSPRRRRRGRGAPGPACDAR